MKTLRRFASWRTSECAGRDNRPLSARGRARGYRVGRSAVWMGTRDLRPDLERAEAMRLAAACGDASAREAVTDWAAAPSRPSKWGAWLGKQPPGVRAAGLVRLSQQLPQDTVSGLPYAYSPELHARLRALGEASELESDADRRSRMSALLEDYLRTVAGPELRAAGEPTWDLLSGHAQHRWRAHANGGRQLPILGGISSRAQVAQTLLPSLPNLWVVSSITAGAHDPLCLTGPPPDPPQTKSAGCRLAATLRCVHHLRRQ